jgi:ribosomal protein S12 methylthiotransferase accessory factor YcaO
VTVIKGDDGSEMAKFNLNINYILFYKKVSYVIRYSMDKPKRLSWTWVEGDAKDVTGSWDLMPVDDGEKTIALHRMYSDLKGSSFIARYILTRQPALEMAVQSLLPLTPLLPIFPQFFNISQEFAPKPFPHG